MGILIPSRLDRKLTMRFWGVLRVRHIWIKLAICSALCMLLQMLIRKGLTGRTSVRLSAPPCGHSFLLSDAVYPWEQTASGPALSCADGDHHQESIESRLRRAKAALGHTPRLVIVGDSRAREIFANTVRVSGHSDTAWHKRPPRNRTEAVSVPSLSPATEPRDFCKIFSMCSYNASYDDIDFQFRWRPFVNRHLSETLQSLVIECDTPGRQCPDTVVINSGMWYSRRVDYMAPLGQHERVLMFQRALQQLMSPLAELARRTRTVWKLEEAVLFEVVKDQYEETLTKTEYMQLIMVLQALVYELTIQIPELVVWSSLLPQVTRHMFHVCAATQPLSWAECPDTMHMGRSLQDGFAALLLDDLYERAVNAAPRRWSRLQIVPS